tara:strand:- start:3749 stop:5491 length:1743 start_codon:yes stop_codon:yes gene_type:complete
MITRKELIKKYLKFFKSKEHKEIQNASLIPEKDPTTLFVSAGMQPLVPFLLGQKHPLGKKLVNVQKIIRTGDIEEVGDSYHHTFFEMLGNWSLGDYWKKEAIEMSFEFLTKILKVPKEKLAVSVFAGDKNAKKDIESEKVWLSLGIPKERIIFLTKNDNWWGPAGKTGPCGPDTEMFYWKSNKKPVPKKFNPNDDNWVEIWNDVLMQYNKDEKGNYNEAKQKNIDTGMGVERTIAILNGIEDDYLTDSFKPIIEKIEKSSGKKYKGNEKVMRIIADHVKAAVFIIAEGITPSNTEQGYVLRRLIRRAVYRGKDISLKDLSKVAEPVFKIYGDYLHLKKNKKNILEALKKEEDKFNSTIKGAIKKLKHIMSGPMNVSPKEVFLLYQSFGMPKELIKEEFQKNPLSFPEKEFQKELEKHQKLSRTATKGKFSAGLADHSDMVKKYHTATHLLHKALKIILGDEVQQMGSNITKERLRFDFNFSRKLTKEEIDKIENLMNKTIKENLPINHKEISYTEAVKSGALSYFRDRYPKIVKVYTIGDFSKEICTGPHVKNTKDLGKFKIIKEESSSSGVRRIKAVLE